MGLASFFHVLVYVVGLFVFLLSVMLSWICHVGHGFVCDVSCVLFLVGYGFGFVFIVFLLFPLRFLLFVVVLFSVVLFFSIHKERGYV